MGFWLNTLITIIVIVILIFIYKAIKKSPEKYFKKAMESHRLGEGYYAEGDAELAQDYYDEADHYRNKGRELENVV